jgi:hypothetical protein
MMLFVLVFFFGFDVGTTTMIGSDVMVLYACLATANA